MSSIRIPVSDLRNRMIAALLSKLALSVTDAEMTVDHLIRCEQAGKFHHGIIRIAYLATSARFKSCHRCNTPEPTRLSPGRIHVDGAGHLGYPVMHRLMEAGCREAGLHGMCIATSASVYPSGALCDWAHHAAQEGMAVVLMASSPPRVTSPCGSKPLVGTNPICIGIPTRPVPFVADGATSEITHGTLLLARYGGTPLPEHAAVGPDGQVTTCAGDVHPSEGQGALLPFGRSHKAFAMAMGIELLVSMGGGVPGDAKQGRHGVFCIFLGPQYMQDAIDAMSQWLRRLDREGVRVPGWTSYRRACGFRRQGVVEVSHETVERLKPLLDTANSIRT